MQLGDEINIPMSIYLERNATEMSDDPRTRLLPDQSEPIPIIPDVGIRFS